ncbi:unnamed protein product, partial [marine sediment metagenome]
MLQVLSLNFMDGLGQKTSRKLVAFSDSRANAAMLAYQIEKENWQDALRQAVCSLLLESARGLTAPQQVEVDLIQAFEAHGKILKSDKIESIVGKYWNDAQVIATVNGLTDLYTSLDGLQGLECARAKRRKEKAAPLVDQRKSELRRIANASIRLEPLFSFDAANPQIPHALQKLLEKTKSSPIGTKEEFLDGRIDGQPVPWTRLVDFTGEEPILSDVFSDLNQRQDYCNLLTELMTGLRREAMGTLFSASYFDIETQGIGHPFMDVASAPLPLAGRVDLETYRQVV